MQPTKGEMHMTASDRFMAHCKQVLHIHSNDHD